MTVVCIGLLSLQRGSLPDTREDGSETLRKHRESGRDLSSWSREAFSKY